MVEVSVEAVFFVRILEETSTRLVELEVNKDEHLHASNLDGERL